MQITKTTLQDVAVLAVDGRLDATTAPPFETALQDELALGATRLVVDLAQVQLISSAALRVLVSAAKQMKKQGGQIALCALTPEVAKVFGISGLASLFNLQATQADALAALGVSTEPALAAPAAAPEPEPVKAESTPVALEPEPAAPIPAAPEPAPEPIAAEPEPALVPPVTTPPSVERAAPTEDLPSFAPIEDALKAEEASPAPALTGDAATPILPVAPLAPPPLVAEPLTPATPAPLAPPPLIPAPVSPLPTPPPPPLVPEPITLPAAAAPVEPPPVTPSIPVTTQAAAAPAPVKKMAPPPVPGITPLPARTLPPPPVRLPQPAAAAATPPPVCPPGSSAKPSSKAIVLIAIGGVALFAIIALAVGLSLLHRLTGGGAVKPRIANQTTTHRNDALPPIPTDSLGSATPAPSEPEQPTPTPRPLAPQPSDPPPATGTAAIVDAGTESVSAGPRNAVAVDQNGAENQQTRKAVLQRIDAMAMSPQQRERLAAAVDHARGMGKIVTINFPNGRTELSSASITELKSALQRPDIQSILNDPSAVFVVLGFADTKGSAQTNKETSQKRADKTLAALRGPCGLSNVMHAIGMGGSEIVDTAHAEKNRAVEVWAVQP